MIQNRIRKFMPLNQFISKYNDRNTTGEFRPVAVGRYGIRKRESIYSKELAKDYSNNKLIYKDTLTVGMGSVQIDIGILSEDTIYSVSPAYHTYKINGINTDYLRYCLQARNQDMFVRYVKRGSRQGKTIDLSRWVNYEIPVYDIDIQQEIVKRLDKVMQVISLRQQQIDELDNLIKSQFVEMFGDPITNSMQWEMKLVTEICTSIYGGGTPSKSHPEYFEGDIPWISPKDMKSDVIKDSIDHITEDAVKNSSAKMVPTNSVLMVIRSGILKHTLPVAINTVPVTVNQDMKVFIPSKQITTQYLAFLFKMIEKDVLSGVRSVTADNIDFNAFKNRMLPVPPIELQNKFVDFVQQTNKLKFAVQKSLNEIQTLFDSLMQEYFG